MKKAIKTLEKRKESLNRYYKELESDDTGIEMTIDYEFVQTSLINIEAEMIEIEQAIKILNNHVIKDES